MARVGILIKHTDGNHDLENVQISGIIDCILWYR